MATNTETTGKKKEEKKQQIFINLEWIFGIRKDIQPNVFLLDKDTIVYPASNYIVIFNFTRNLNSSNLQKYITGQPNSKGITAIACTNISKRIVGFSEDCNDGILISFYQIAPHQGFKNFPKNQNSYKFPEQKLNHTYCMAFTRRKKKENYIVALASNETDYYFIVWNWDTDSVREQQPFVKKVELHEAKYEEKAENSHELSSSGSGSMKEEPSEEKQPNQSYESNAGSNAFKDEPIKINVKNHFEISFSNINDNELFSLVSKYSVVFYNISGSEITENYRIGLVDEEGYKDYGTEIFGSTWLYDGEFCMVTDTYINIFDGKFKQLVQKIFNNNGLRIITPYSLTTNFNGFIAGGLNKTLQFYTKKTIEEENTGNNQIQEKTTEQYCLAFEKTKYDFIPGVNEKITDDKVLQNEKFSVNDRPFDFLTIITNYDEPYCIATTTNNDLLQINTDEKEIDRALIKYLISPFHSESIEGMDICINKPYIITCSKDKSVRVWDYQFRLHIISKIFEEELYSIAYHPSGMHALVSTDDKIYPLNIFYDEIDNMAPPITTKSKSKDIKFSNMGHLFAFDSGTVVQIYDFLNMQIYPGPPSFGLHKFNFSGSSNKINYLSWGDDDKNLLASGTGNIYDWEIKNEIDVKPKIGQMNVTSTIYCDKNKTVLASTDDRCLRKLAKDSFNYSVETFTLPMKELHAFKKSRIIICATTRPILNTENSSSQDNVEKTEINNNITTCLRVFPEIGKSYDYIDIPSHQGETMRVRYNFEENKIFTCGEDGCINVYSIEIPFDNSEPEKFLNDQSNSFTNTVLIKRGEFKIREFNKKELPAKREEKLKKIRSENNDKREADKKLLDEKKNKISTTKYREKNKIEQMQKDLKNTELAYNSKIKEEIQSNDNKHDTQFNNNQIELSVKTREVESIRQVIKQEKEQHKREMQRIQKEAKENKEKALQEFDEKKKDLEGNKTELEGKIKSLENNQIEDSAALDWLNKEVISEIDKNITELRTKIDELKVHYTHHIKKQKEEKEKLQQTGDNLNFELKKIEEDQDRLKITKAKNEKNKEKAEKELGEMTKRISEIENKIIECKKAHTYLEKCKFVLTYKIQELKKEAGPMEKVLEDLQLRTKEDELSLSKYNREFDIISQKIVDMEDLREKTKIHEKTEHDLKNEINAFKIDLFNMLPFIDDYDKLREGFRNLREKYLTTYVPEIQDHELESEFSNQKSKMKNRVLELQSTLKTLKQQHKENIFENRFKNNEMIQDIEKLKQTIKSVKKSKETINGDQKHANAVAEIFASQTVKKLMMENISIKDKIQVFQEKIRIKKAELAELKERVKIDPAYAGQMFDEIDIVPEEKNEGSGDEREEE